MSKIDGKTIAAELLETVGADVAAIKTINTLFAPKLTIVQVGGREDSAVYIRMKKNAGEKVSLAIWCT